MTSPAFDDTQTPMGWDRKWLIPATVIAMTTALLAALFKLLTGYPAQPSGWVTLCAAVVIALLAALVRFLRYLMSMWREGEERPAKRIRAEVGPAAMAFAPIAAGIAVLSVFIYSFSFLKSMLPAVIPFWADAALSATDRALLIDSEAIAVAIRPSLDALAIYYGLWQFVHLGSLLWVLHWSGFARARHILSFMLTWSIGTVVAFAFSSAGPIFTGDYDRAAAAEMTRRTADFLWANYQSDGALLGAGISAFPSMHLALAAWFAIVLRDRGWPRLGVAYVLSMFPCSFILGWHYVVDGVAGVAIALAGDRIARAWLIRSATVEAASAQPAFARS